MKKLFYHEILLSNKNPFWIDVRSPKEYAHGHIPQAHSIPLFSDEERAIVGTIYKQQGKKAAIEKGLSLIRLPFFIEKLKAIQSPEKIYIYCARGGMRSSSMGWLFSLLGYEVYLLEGGYKSYRQTVLKTFEREYPLLIVSGKTGVGKTAMLYELEKKNQNMIDLEKMALHRGSVFGFTHQAQPTQMQFENDLAHLLQSLDDKPIWVEDESKNIGSIRIPEAFYQQMKKAHTFSLQSSLERRIGRIIEDYQDHTIQDIETALFRLQKRLGLEKTKKALALLQDQKKQECVRLLLQYYDGCYEKCFSKRDKNTFHEVPYDVDCLIQKQQTVLFS